MGAAISARTVEEVTFTPSPGGQGGGSCGKCSWQREHSKGPEVGREGILERVIRTEVTVAIGLDQERSSRSQ